MLKRYKTRAAFIIAFVIALLGTMLFAFQLYMKRRLQSRLRTASDDIGSRYEPYYLPDGYDLINEKPGPLAARNEVLDRLRDNGTVSQDVFDQGSANYTHDRDAQTP